MRFPGPRNGVDLNKLVLQRGGHYSKESGMCVMEATSNYFWNIHNDNDVREVNGWIIEAMMELNDTAKTVRQLQKLKRYIPDLVRTGDSTDIPEEMIDEYNSLETWDEKFKMMGTIIRAAVHSNKKRPWRPLKPLKPRKVKALPKPKQQKLDMSGFNHEESETSASTKLQKA
jgi:hypothetical protein